jgi:hypothetical protein
MDVQTGDAFRLRQELIEETEVGEQIEMTRLREKVTELGAAATADEQRASRAGTLVAVSEQAARKLQLGERELERRRRRRKAEKRARA